MSAFVLNVNLAGDVDEETKRQLDESFSSWQSSSTSTIIGTTVSTSSTCQQIIMADNDEKEVQVQKSTNIPTTFQSSYKDLAIVQAESIRIFCNEPLSVRATKKDGTVINSSEDGSATTTSTPWAAIFCHSTIIQSAFEEHRKQSFGLEDKQHPTVSFPFRNLKEEDQLHSFSQKLLFLLHPLLEKISSIKAVISMTKEILSSSERRSLHAPSDIVLIDLSNTPSYMVNELIETTNCEMIHAGQPAILKILLLHDVVFNTPSTTTPSIIGSNHPTTIEFPTCPVCLHRIDPYRLGLPKPHGHQLCSKLCPKPQYTINNNTQSTSVTVIDDIITCQRQRLLRPWKPPSLCLACHVIWDYYWNNDHNNNNILNPITKVLVCSYCSMQETLWVCLTCSFVGCGRYSNMHAAQHNVETKHPFCLELSTGRIWSYVDSEYVHRTDLLDCPCSLSSISTTLLAATTTTTNQHRLQQLTLPVSKSIPYSSVAAEVPPSSEIAGSNASGHLEMAESIASVQGESAGVSGHYSRDSCHHFEDFNNYPSLASAVSYNNTVLMDEKSPKKATMISEEYEALLQSALEDQAQHYEGQITSLRAMLTAEQVDTDSMSIDEQNIIEQLKDEIEQLRNEIDNVASKELLDYQAQEAGHRATSQRLLREQRIIQDLLQRIRDEIIREHEQYQLQIEELEYQIRDLTANQKMRYQFEHDVELVNGQIIASSSAYYNSNSESENQHQQGINTRSSKKGSKLRRFFKR